MRKNKIVTFSTLIFLGIFTLAAWFKPADAVSESERRHLTQFPEMSAEMVFSGRFMEAFESYAVDQFPLRDAFRAVKAFFSTKILGQKDHHGIYIADGYACRMEYPLNEASLQRVCQRFRYVYDKYMADSDVQPCFSIIPDKNYFLAEANGYLSMDYDRFFTVMLENTDYMKYIDITGLLSIEDYYKTDLHWRQERIPDVAKAIAVQMGAELNEDYNLQILDTPFYGVYYGQSALHLEPEEMMYLTNPTLESCRVYDYENNRKCGIYDMEKACGADPYEMYLSGPVSLISIENPQARTDKELILFRDSFGSSIAPLFAEAYSRVTLVDIRYIHPDLLGRYITFQDQDVLFLYSVPVLNNGETIK